MQNYTFSRKWQKLFSYVWKNRELQLEAGLAEALVEGGGYGGAVHVLADEDEFLHTVAESVIPVA